MSKLALVMLAACQLDEPATGTVEQHGMNMQGMNMQGASLAGIDLANVRVEKGELVADENGDTLRGTALVGAHFYAQVASAADPSVTAQVEYRITAIEPESASYDPTHTGSTYLYTLEQYVTDTGTWATACGADLDGRHVAIPLTATWNAHGDRVESSTLFTFACTTGVIAKCYRWGYRPWLTGYGNIVDYHETCTRLARADYCGNGIPHTHDGTWVNVWDLMPPPGPIQTHGLLTPVGMVFEAGWNTQGAVCVSRARWLLDDTLANLCPDHLIPPGLLGATVCDTVSEALGYDGGALMFDESYLNLITD